MYITDTIPGQPSFAYVEFRVGDEDILYSTAEATKCLLSFSYQKNSDTSANRWELSLFDSRWDYLESKIAADYQRIMFRYGYYDQGATRLSPYQTGMVVNLVPRLEIDGTILTVSGTSDIYMMDKNQNLEKRFRKWGGKQYLIHEIVQKICEENNWYLKEYVKTAPVYDIDDQFSTYPELKTYHQKGVSDLAFIKNVLIPNSITENGIGGFRFWFDDQEQAKTGWPTCYFKPYEDWGGSVIKTYIYMRGHDGYGEVISWQPDLAQRWGFLLKGYNSKMSSVNVFTKRTISPSALYELPANTIGSGEAKAYKQNIVTGRVSQAGDYNYRVATNDWIKEVMTIASQDLTQPDAYQAEIQVVGDPYRVPHEDIYVICTTNDGRLHYSTGKYKIITITDTIDSNGFLSNFNLLRQTDSVRSMDHQDYDNEDWGR